GQAAYADPQLASAFAALFQSCPMLFVGYGLSDDDFDQLLTRVRAFAGDQPPRHFALVAAEALKPFRRRELEQAGLRLLLCHDRDETFADSARLLRAIAAPPSESSVAPAPRQAAAAPPAAPSRPSEPRTEHALQPPGAPYHKGWYVHREEEESRALAYLETAGAPVVLWAPELFGKSTTLRYLLDHVQAQDAADGKQSLVIELDLGALLPSDRPRDLDALLENMARSAVQQVPEGDEAWVSALAGGRDPWPIKLRKLFQKHLLPTTDRLFLVVERADEVWGLPFQGELYGMFRSWCELGHKDPWARLRVLMALSTTPSLVLDGPEGSRSPWNLVPPIELSDLGLDQVEALARLYQLDWPREALAERVVPLVGGHPHHLRTLMYKAGLRRLSLDALLVPSSLEALFSQHFGRLIKRLELKRSPGEPPLEEAVRAILRDPGANLDETTFQRLLGVGLVTRGEAGYQLRYSLDERYLRKRWAIKRDG
ncbi:MAG: AAA-like domain-containing protein, partial [Minicystis sp.]